MRAGCQFLWDRYGMRCGVKRDDEFGDWCAYVDVPERHPARMRTHDSPTLAHLRKSCGLTFSGQTGAGAWTLGMGHGGAGLSFNGAKAAANRLAAQLAVMVR